MKRNIFKIAAIMILAGGLYSCTETVHESLWILIRNGTDSLIHVRLFPNEKHIHPCYGFTGSDLGSGQRNLERALEPNESTYEWAEVIYVSSNLDIAPHALASEVFDSIYISTAKQDSVIIKFTHENVTGYSENIFSEHSIWDFEVRERNKHGVFSKIPLRDHQYRFMILKEEMTNNQ